MSFFEYFDSFRETPNDSLPGLFTESSYNINLHSEFILPFYTLNDGREDGAKNSNEKNNEIQIEEQDEDKKYDNIFNDSSSISNFEINKIISNKMEYQNKNENEKENSKTKECESCAKITFMTEKPKDSTIFTKGEFNEYTNRIFNEGLDLFYKNNNKINNSKIKSREILIEKKFVKKSRKYKSDLIRIKFMNRFFKTLIKQINKKLKVAGSKLLFEYLPRIFILQFKTYILNSRLYIANADLTLEEIFSKKFCKIQKKLNKKRFKKNNDTLVYLKSQANIKICEESNFNIFKDMKFSEIFNEYLYSKEFGKDIYIFKNPKKLKRPEDDEYIRNYIFRAIEFQKLFS